MKKLLCLPVMAILAACGSGSGSKDNTSPNGDVHGDGRCTNNYISAYNQLDASIKKLENRLIYATAAETAKINQEGAEVCESFVKYHGSISCRAHRIQLNVDTTVGYSDLKSDCDSFIEKRNASNASAPASSGVQKNKVSIVTDSTLIEDIDEQWAKNWIVFQVKSDFLSSDSKDFLNGDLVNSIELSKAILERTEISYCSLDNTVPLKSGDFLKFESSKKSSNGGETIQFSPSTVVLCSSFQNGKAVAMTFGQMKKAFGKYINVVLTK